MPEEVKSLPTYVWPYLYAKLRKISFLKAIVAGETALSSSGVIEKYRLNSSSNVTRSRNGLIDKEILDNNAGTVSFQDPMYRFWLKNFFFNKSGG